MPTQPETHGTVKSICDNLECSPSQNQPTSAIYHGSSDNPQAKKKEAKHPESSPEKEAKFGGGRKKAIKGGGGA